MNGRVGSQWCFWLIAGWYQSTRKGDCFDMGTSSCCLVYVGCRGLLSDYISPAVNGTASPAIYQLPQQSLGKNRIAASVYHLDI